MHRTLTGWLITIVLLAAQVASAGENLLRLEAAPILAAQRVRAHPARKPGRFRLVIGDSWALPSSQVAMQNLVIRGLPSRLGIADEGLSAARFGVTVTLGHMAYLGKASAPLAGVDIRYRLPMPMSMSAAGSKLLLALRVGLFRNWSRERSQVVVDENVDFGVRAVPLLLMVHYQLPVRVVSAFFGGGGGLMIGRVALLAPSAGPLRALEVVPVVSAFTGIDAPAGPGRAGIEVGYWHAPLRHAVVADNFGGVYVTAGYRVGF